MHTNATINYYSSKMYQESQLLGNPCQTAPQYNPTNLRVTVATMKTMRFIIFRFSCPSAVAFIALNILKLKYGKKKSVPLTM